MSSTSPKAFPQGRLPQARLPLAVTPRGGAAGSVVKLSATGLAPQTGMLLVFASLQSYQIVQDVATDSNGDLSATALVPGWAEQDRVHYFFVSFADERPIAQTAGFHVTSQAGTARVEGTVVGLDGEGFDLRDAKDVLYHLVGNVGTRAPGTRLALVGRIADGASCPGSGIGVDVADAMGLPG